MKNNIDNIIAVVAFILLAMGAFYLMRSWRQQEQKIKELERTVASVGTGEVKKTKISTAGGELSSTTAEVLKATKKSLQKRYAQDIEDVKGAGVRKMDVTGVSHVTTVLRDTVYVMAEPTDSGMHVGYSDAYAKIDVDIDSARKAKIAYEVHDSLVLVEHQRKHRLLFGLIRWNETEKVEVHSKNPRSEVESLEIIRLTDR